MSPLRAHAWIAVIVITLGACASGPPKTEVSSSIAAANAAVNHARTDGALAAAPDALLNAQQKLDQAQTAAKNDDGKTAIRLADEARAEADFADAKSQAVRAEKAAHAINSDVDTLQQQTTSPKPGDQP